MNAIELLKKQHREVEQLFERVEKSKDSNAKKKAFQEIVANLVAHDGIEREIFYPAVEKATGLTDDLGEALAEHGTVEFCLYEAIQAQGKKDFDFKVKALKDVLQHHIDEEEEELLPASEKALGKEKITALGAKMEKAFEEKKAGDAEAALFGNLRQVMAGVLKPAPAPTKRKPSATQLNGASRSAKKPASKRAKAAPKSRKTPTGSTKRKAA